MLAAVQCNNASTLPAAHTHVSHGAKRPCRTEKLISYPHADPGPHKKFTSRIVQFRIELYNWNWTKNSLPENCKNCTIEILKFFKNFWNSVQNCTVQHCTVGNESKSILAHVDHVWSTSVSAFLGYPAHRQTQTNRQTDRTNDHTTPSLSTTNNTKKDVNY